MLSLVAGVPLLIAMTFVPRGVLGLVAALTAVAWVAFVLCAIASARRGYLKEREGDQVYDQYADTTKSRLRVWRWATSHRWIPWSRRRREQRSHRARVW
jgi:hypothetical protein